MATCADCVHVGVCKEYVMGLAAVRGVDLNMDELKAVLQCDDCDHFKERSHFVELPCKVGDDVYCIYHGKIERSGVTSICIGSHYTDIVIYTVQFSFTAENIGKFIFFSVEEAEQALKEREENDH